MQTEAEEREEVVLSSAQVYRDTFIEFFAAAVRKGRIPGTAELTDEETRDFFRSVPPEYFQNLAQQNPQQALQQLNQFEALEQKAGWAG